MKKTLELISCEDYVIQYNSDAATFSQFKTDFTGDIFNYARLLKQPLTLGMFVPCDSEGNVLKFDYPHKKAFDDIAQIEFQKQYQQALDRVVFEGFYVFASIIWTEIRRGNIRILFDGEEITVERIDSFSCDYEKQITSISDLCGLGLKYFGQ